jgi:hypothetical protein
MTKDLKMATTTQQQAPPQPAPSTVGAIAASLRDSAQTVYHKVAKSTSSPPPSFDPQASTNYKEAFALFDKRGNGRVAIESLGDLLRACGQNPTLAEIDDLAAQVKTDCTCKEED